MEVIPEINADVLKNIAENASSDLIMFFIILAVVLVPLIIVLQRGRASQSAANAKREQKT